MTGIADSNLLFIYACHPVAVQSSTDPLLDFHHPMTFRSRGVAMPFTTPLLAGTCVRHCKREGVELVVPSPSGGRGVYILRWSGVRALCNPTVHDTLLFQRSSRLTSVDPASIRETALEVAREGHAGRAASTAAEAALVHDRSQRALTHVLLLKGLVEQFDPGGPNIATFRNGRRTSTGAPPRSCTGSRRRSGARPPTWKPA